MAASIVFSKRSPSFDRAAGRPASKDLTLRRRLEGFRSISAGKVRVRHASALFSGTTVDKKIDQCQ